MKKSYTFLSLLISSLLVLGCASISTFQTAEVLPKGKIVFGGGLNAMGSEGVVFFPIPEIYGRYGLSDKLDAGVKYTLPLTIGGDVKYQLTKGPLAVALNPGWSFFGIGGNDAFVGFLALYPQLLLSTKNLYFGVKGMYGIALAELVEEKETLNSGLFGGGCVGLKLGTGRLSLMPEFNFLFGLAGPAGEEGMNLFQGGIGFAVEF